MTPIADVASRKLHHAVHTASPNRQRTQSQESKMHERMTWKPIPTGLPWNQTADGLVCPACPDHSVGATDGVERYEIVMEVSSGIHGQGHVDSVRVIRRVPDDLSGPFDLRALPASEAALAAIDYLERQTFVPADALRLLEVLGARFPADRIHVWPIGVDIAGRLAEDAIWDEPTRKLFREPLTEVSFYEYPADVGWDSELERVKMADGREVEVCRGCLYVDLANPSLVQHGWSGFGGSTAAKPGSAATATEY